jgi:hypothetical protein
MNRTACINLPDFPVQLLLCRHPDWKHEPVAVVDADKPQGTILYANQRARSFRILPGMRYAGGLSLAAGLRAAVVASKEIEINIGQLSKRLRRFSPHVETAKDEPGVFWLDAFDTITWDYRTMDHSARGHPMAALRDELSARKLPDARNVNRMQDGQQVRYAGMVICRQRPGTARGVVFLTLEDESGFVNVVVWSKILEKNALLIKALNFLGVSGSLQKEDEVVHVVADNFWDPQTQIRLSPASGGSRDFH